MWSSSIFICWYKIQFSQTNNISIAHLKKERKKRFEMKLKFCFGCVYHHSKYISKVFHHFEHIRNTRSSVSRRKTICFISTNRFVVQTSKNLVKIKNNFFFGWKHTKTLWNVEKYSFIYKALASNNTRQLFLKQLSTYERIYEAFVVIFSIFLFSFKSHIQKAYKHSSSPSTN